MLELFLGVILAKFLLQMLGTFYQKTIFISDKKVVDFYLSFPEGDAVLIGFSGRSDYHIGKARTADRLHDLARLVNHLFSSTHPPPAFGGLGASWWGVALSPKRGGGFLGKQGGCPDEQGRANDQQYGL